jgi:hypothetical protein
MEYSHVICCFFFNVYDKIQGLGKLIGKLHHNFILKHDKYWNVWFRERIIWSNRIL